MCPNQPIKQGLRSLPKCGIGHIVDASEVWGERRLLWEILDEARLCLHGRVAGTTGKTDRLREIRDAQRWFASAEDTGVFSFVNVCRCLGLEPSCIRRWARRDGAHVAVLGLRGRQQRLAPKKARAA